MTQKPSRQEILFLAVLAVFLLAVISAVLLSTQQEQDMQPHLLPRGAEVLLVRPDPLGLIRVRGLRAGYVDCPEGTLARVVEDPGPEQDDRRRVRVLILEGQHEGFLGDLPVIQLGPIK